MSRGLKGIFVVAVSGGRPRRLPIEVEGIGLYDVAPEETRLAYATIDALYVAELETGDVR